MTDENLRVLSEETPEKIRENSRFSALGKLIGAALDDFAEGRPLVVQPFVRYCFYRQAELSNVRIILSGLNNQIEKNAVRARIRETYEG